MAKDQKTLLSDEILQFLYKNASFQGLGKTEQQQLLERFGQDENFVEILEISMSLQEIIQEVEATMPKMRENDYLLPLEQQKHLLKERSVVKGNVYFVPFNEDENIFSPMIILMQQSETLKAYETFCKGTIMPFFHLCATQKRDLIIIPFSETVQEPMIFIKGSLQLGLFDRFINEYMDNEATIVPAIEQVLAIFKADTACNERDVLIITDNLFNDYQSLIQEDYAARFEKLDIDISVIAMSEIDFEAQPIPFAQKVYFANE
ncbi:hypothetical protein LZ480_07330 [Solibacillus sp. MA9]|uniref:Enhanced serine sensitivity protein SseB n=1 Tax=Solibacillus palustris TaxID=2908203 RepID=A0ABS9UBU8_9BACL|nr:hypothetical protein [Solibacillus sp. MA9]MCH7321703.1 hypothetical protein [Solibacillus sp. MA9]